jgi:hypothetical protein
LDKRAGGWTIGMDFLSRMGQILAAGGQPILPGVQRTDRSNAVPALLDAGGRPNPALRSLRRMVSFANHFGHVYADADASLQTTVQAPDALRPGGFSVIVVEGNAGRVNFVFRGPDSAKGERFDETSLITADGARLQVIFVTVDPQRDNPAVLREYTAAFDPDFLGLRGDEAVATFDPKRTAVLINDARAAGDQLALAVGHRQRGESLAVAPATALHGRRVARGPLARARCHRAVCG